MGQVAAGGGGKMGVEGDGSGGGGSRLYAIVLQGATFIY